MDSRSIIATVIALLSACTPITVGDFEAPVSEEPAENKTEYIIDTFEITKVFKTYVYETGFSYYTVYAVNLETGETECIGDDIGEDVMPEFEWLITIGQKVTRVYEKGQPSYTGMLYPVYE